MSAREVKVPDIGDFKDVPVIEVLVQPGDRVAAEDSLVTLESDKATLDVPAPEAGVVKVLRVKVGDKVSEGSVILLLDAGEVDAVKGAAAAGGASANSDATTARSSSASSRHVASSAPASSTSARAAPANPAAATTSGPTSSAGKVPPAASTVPAQHAVPASAPDPEAAAAGGKTLNVVVPDIGDFKDVPVIDVFVKPGDLVNAEDSLVTLESDKATMDVPSPASGRVKELKVKVGDKVSEGSVVLTLETSTTKTPQSEPRSTTPEGTSTQASPGDARSAPSDARAPSSTAPAVSPASSPSSVPEPSVPVEHEAFTAAHASPSVRRFARELGVDLARVGGSGPKNRILQEDVQKFVKGALQTPAAVGATAPTGGAGLNLLPWPNIDFRKFGEIEEKPLSRIKKISGANLARNWVMIPHVTQFDEADITELEAFRVTLNKENEKAGIKVTMLAFLIKASVAALQRFPDVNASINGDTLVYKKYFNIGFAADTPNGLVVPVIRNAEQKGVLQIAKEMGELSTKAREGKLGPAEMQGGSFSISSLGGIGGTAFTPIINAPEVAILGVSKSIMQPVWDGKAFAPRLMLPLSLSYDHRVVDGAQAARFTTYLAQLLVDLKRTVL